MQKRAAFYILIIMILILLSSVSFEATQPPLIRLHILANSNSEKDQYLKYKVRDRVVSEMSEKFRNSHSIEETRQIVQLNLYQLEEEARKTLKELGCQDDVEAVFCEDYFPTKYYGEFSLPAGSYEAVKIIIGQGKGANWWCVLFPPLCFVDGQKTKACIEEGIEKEIQSARIGEKEIKIKPAFKVVEVWESVFGKEKTD